MNNINNNGNLDTPVKVLLVDDSKDNRLLIHVYLKKLDVIVEDAENGEEALAKFKDNSYDLIFMDIQMPVMDGFTATQLIREYEQENNMPETIIIALTAYSVQDVLDKAIQSGCNEYITKPVKKSTIIDIINQNF